MQRIHSNFGYLLLNVLLNGNNSTFRIDSFGIFSFLLFYFSPLFFSISILFLLLFKYTFILYQFKIRSLIQRRIKRWVEKEALSGAVFIHLVSLIINANHRCTSAPVATFCHCNHQNTPAVYRSLSFSRLVPHRLSSVPFKHFLWPFLILTILVDSFWSGWNEWCSSLRSFEFDRTIQWLWRFALHFT